MSYDLKMRWYHPAGVILALLLGLGLGRALAPRYHPPADSSETQLKARGVEYYQAGRLFDTMKIRQLMSPARQTAEAEKLIEDAARARKHWDDLDAAAQADQHKSAERVTPDCIETEMYTGEGWGWAVTFGKAMLEIEGREIEQQLERKYWVLSDGDWWLYERTIAELNTYGNPPDPMMQEMKQGGAGNKPGVLQMSATGAPDSPAPAATGDGVTPAAPAPEEPSPDGEPGA